MTWYPFLWGIFFLLMRSEPNCVPRLANRTANACAPSSSATTEQEMSIHAKPSLTHRLQDGRTFSTLWPTILLPNLPSPFGGDVRLIGDLAGRPQFKLSWGVASLIRWTRKNSHLASAGQLWMLIRSISVFLNVLEAHRSNVDPLD